MSYQAVAHGDNGKPVVNQKIFLKINLTGEANSTQYYSEHHEVTTDEFGLFNIVIGEGLKPSGEMLEVPWATEQIWLEVEMSDHIRKPLKMVSRSELLSVPYAFHSNTATKLADNKEASLRNQSIYWLTSGNSRTVPPYHFIGTLDSTPLVFKTDSTTRMILTADGQLQMYSGVTGAQDDPKSYPLTIEGSDQGIYIKVNGSRSNDNNFLTFADQSAIWGRVEGEKWGELIVLPDYKIQQNLFILQGVSLIAQEIGLGIEVVGLAASGFGAGAAAGAAAEAVALGIEYASFLVETINYDKLLLANIGVHYQSGGADYAEWLERAPNSRDLLYGEIVGVNAGKISLNTDTAEHFLVVSLNPIVLGNMPQLDREENFEKVSFMGQVPVRIAGPVEIGDYILPSGNHDGMGIAIAPEKMKAGDYNRIIGVAWEAAEDKPLNFVNVAVGINSNDLSSKVEELNNKVEMIMDYLEGKGPLPQDGVNPTTNSAVKKIMAQETSIFNKTYTDAEFDQLVDDHSEVFVQVFGEAKRQMIKRGYDVENTPELKGLFDDPVNHIKEVRRDPRYMTQWSLIDQKISSKN
ncbi:MAG: hypothetical protein Sapg2KO_52710 [Saprospiraceae bacterium]